MILWGLLTVASGEAQAAPFTPRATPASATEAPTAEDVSEAKAGLNPLLSITLDHLGSLAINVDRIAEGISGSIDFSESAAEAKRCQIAFSGVRRSQNTAELQFSGGNGRSNCGFNPEATLQLDRSQGKAGNTINGTFSTGNSPKGHFSITLPR